MSDTLKVVVYLAVMVLVIWMAIKIRWATDGGIKAWLRRHHSDRGSLAFKVFLGLTALLWAVIFLTQGDEPNNRLGEDLRQMIEGTEKSAKPEK